jgi:hypothetical protein
MRFAERQQQIDDRLPGAGALRLEQVAADLTRQLSRQPEHRLRVVVVGRRCHRRRIEDEHVLRERGDHQSGVHPGQLLRGGGRAGLHQHFDPRREPIGIELLVRPRAILPPQIEIEDALQLTGRGERDEVAGVFEATGLNDAVEHLRAQLPNGERRVRRVEDARDQPAAHRRFAGCELPAAAGRPRRAATARLRPRRLPPRGPIGFRHGSGDDTGATPRETVLNGGVT